MKKPLEPSWAAQVFKLLLDAAVTARRKFQIAKVLIEPGVGCVQRRDDLIGEKIRENVKQPIHCSERTMSRCWRLSAIAPAWLFLNSYFAARSRR